MQAISSKSDDGREDVPIRSVEELEQPFRAAEKPAELWRVGAEAEKFGVNAATGTPISYDGEHGVLRVFAELCDAHGWSPEREMPGGPVIALRRERASITLEPGAQLELSGAPLESVHAIQAEMRGHLNELRQISSEMNLSWLGVGFQPLARQDELPWVPKLRYPIMRAYLPSRGEGALDMMRRTATVQANFDYDSEADAMLKLAVLLRLSPLLNAMTANSPFVEGRLAHKKSVRQEVWLRMDPARSGLIPRLWAVREARYRDYVEWALDAGMFYFKREGELIPNTGQSFRDFLAHGFQGHRATMADWRLHLNTLFPEVRLKRTIEVRCCDSLPTGLLFAVPALLTGILYDARALAEARELVAPFRLEAIEAQRPLLLREGLGAELEGRPARELALRVLEIATGGLQRRACLNASGQDESIYLRKLGELVVEGRSPADILTDGLRDEDPDLAVEVLARTRV